MDWLSVFSDPALARYGQLFLLLVTRILPIITFTPLFGGPQTPTQFRMAFSALLAFVFLPLLSVSYPQATGETVFLALLAKEALIGGIFALLIKILFELLAASGALIDLARGATIANVLDPVSREQRSLTYVFLSTLLVTLFLSVGGHRVLIGSLADSFARYPPGVLLPQGIAQQDILGPEAGLELAGLLATFFVAAVRVAMPVIAVIFAVDIGLGLINKVSPRIQVFFLGMTIKGTLGVLILFLVFTLVARTLLDGALGGIAQLVNWF